MTIAIFILALLVVVEVLFIFKWKISTLALIYYIEKKQYDPPNGKDIQECTTFVVKKCLD